MKKKFKIIDTSTGQKLKLKEGEMLVMNSQGVFFLVGNFMDYDTYVRKLSDMCHVFDVIWVGGRVMKVYILYEQYYDFCEVWDNILGVYDSEDKAVLAQIKEEEQEKYKVNPEQCSTKIEEHDLL